MKVLISLTSLALIALFQVNLHSQQIWDKQDANPFKIGETWGNYVVIDTVEILVVDAISNALPENPGSDCNGSVVSSSVLPAGIYVVGITGGPGITYHVPNPTQYHVAFYHPLLEWPNSLYGGLSGLAERNDPMSYHIFESDGGLRIEVYIVDNPCSDNEGYIEVTIAELSAPAPNCDDFEDGDYHGWIIESGTWDASGGSFCQSSNVLGAYAHTPLIATWQDGFRLAANTYLVEPLSYKGRSVYWMNEERGSWILMTYSGHVPGEMGLQCVLNGETVYSSTYTVSQEEWDGSDGLWHELKMQIVGNHLQGWRDDELLFETWDDRLLQMPKEGYVRFQTWGSHTCFDDICFTNVTQ